MKCRIVENAEVMSILFPDGSMDDLTPEKLIAFLKGNLVKGADDERSWKKVCLDISLYPGNTVAYVTDNNEIVFKRPDAIVDVLYKNSIRYLSATDYGDMYGVGREQIKVYCQDGRIPGAVKMAGRWMVPADAPYPSVRPRKARLIKA